MKLAIALLVICSIFGTSYGQNTCQAHAAESCRDSTGVWTDGSVCNAVYGNIHGNKRNLAKIMADHFKQSFQFIAMVSKHLLF